MAGPGICVLCLADTCASEVHPVFNPVAPYGNLLPNMYLFIADINCEEQRQPSSKSAWPACPNTVNRAPKAGGEKVQYNLHSSL